MVVYVVGSCRRCDQQSVSPQAHAALLTLVLTSSYMTCSDQPQFVVCLIYFLQTSTPSTPSLVPDTWWCGRVGPNASQSCFHAAAIHASFDRSSWMKPSISWASILQGWRDLCCRAGCARLRVAASRLKPAWQSLPRQEDETPHGMYDNLCPASYTNSKITTV